MNSKKIKSKLKRIVSAIVALAMTATTFSTFSVAAEQQNVVYPYAVFAVQNVKINTEGFTLNGNAYSKGDFVYSSKNASINGKITDADDIKEKSDNTEDFDVNSDLILIHNKIANKYFSSDCDKKDKDYSISDVNVNINKSVYVTGKLGLNGNINLNKAVGAVSDIDFSGGTLNGNSTVIYSKFGNINISNNNSSVSGLIYAPFGTVTISGDNFNFDGVIIAENIIIKGKGANINYNKAAAMIVGSESEKFSCDFSDWKYMPDNDKDGLPDLIEKEVGTDSEKEDTDGDKLPDGYEALTLGTDPLKADTDDNGVNDGDEDFDKDGLNNLDEYNRKTDPLKEDTDGDGLSDGDEVNNYGTDPLKKDTDDDGLEDGDEVYLKTDPTNPDSNGNGVKDGDEKFSQTFTHKVKNKDCAVTEVSVSMKGTGNLQKTTTVDSVMNKDMLCTGVVGLVGEPFSVETKSKFDKATLTFKIDKTKLGNIKFDDLMFLWYNEKENNFVELETKLDSAKSTASIETTHFSKYMVVDKQAWFDNWRQIYDSYEKLLSTNPSITSICVDCSGSMSTNDPSFQLYDHTSSCYRNLAVQGFADAMFDSDKTSIITFEYSAKELCALTSNKNTLKSNARFYNGGGTNANSAIDIALKELKNESGNKSIILMSDGDVNVTDANIKLAKKNSIKIHTVGLGYGADNAKLKQYAEKTGGEHFIVKTAVGLEEIYDKLSANNQLNFDGMADSDDDGVPDDIEISGIPMPNGKLVYTNPNDKDSDTDGHSDGKEVGMLKRTQGFEINTTAQDQVYKFEFDIKSDPTKEDSDDDGYSDIEDPDPMDKPEILGDKYDFLDGEIYYLAKMTGIYPEYYMDVEGNSTIPGTSLIMYNYTGNDNQKFKFEWCDVGYKIHALNNEHLVLTLNANDDGSYSVYMGNDLNLQGQLWEVLPYNNGANGLLGENGLVIRSKVLYYENNDTVGQPLYLSYKNDQISVSTDRISNTRLMTCAIADWTRFGDAYMQYVGWTYMSYSANDRAMKNYAKNSTKLPNILKNDSRYSSISSSYSKTGCINGQGNFSKLKFGDTTFDGVGCEVLATYNAMARQGINVDLCKLTAEFEMNAIQITGPLADGKSGSKPERIPDCLESYSLSPGYTDSIIYINPFKTDSSQKENLKKIQEKLDKNGRVIFSAWNYNNGGIDIKYGVHTVYIEKGSSNIVIYNCYNSWTEPETSYASIEDMFSSSDPLFSTLVIGIWY